MGTRSWVSAKQRLAAKLLLDGMSGYRALIEAGYSRWTARRSDTYCATPGDYAKPSWKNKRPVTCACVRPRRGNDTTAGQRLYW